MIRLALIAWLALLVLWAALTLHSGDALAALFAVGTIAVIAGVLFGVLALWVGVVA